MEAEAAATTPAVSAAPAVDASPSTPTGATPAVDTGSPAASVAPDAAPAPAVETPAVEAAPVPEAPPVIEFPDHGTFDWDAWDGSMDSMDERIRPWMESAQTRTRTDYEAQLAEAEAKYNQLNTAFDAALEGGDDPRLGELQGKYTDLEGQHAELNQRWQARELQDHQDAAEWTKWFLDQHKETLAQPENRTKYIDYLNADFEPDDAVTLLGFNEEAVAEALGARADGTPSARAVQIAELFATKKQLPPPRATAEVVGGATPGSGRTANTATRNTADVKDINARRLAVSRKALNSAK